jgi:hypothetical protein
VVAMLESNHLLPICDKQFNKALAEMHVLFFCKTAFYRREEKNSKNIP